MLGAKNQRERIIESGQEANLQSPIAQLHTHKSELPCPRGKLSITGDRSSIAHQVVRDLSLKFQSYQGKTNYFSCELPHKFLPELVYLINVQN